MLVPSLNNGRVKICKCYRSKYSWVHTIVHNIIHSIIIVICVQFFIEKTPNCIIIVSPRERENNIISNRTHTVYIIIMFSIYTASINGVIMFYKSHYHYVRVCVVCVRCLNTKKKKKNPIAVVNTPIMLP